jgi:hypothetical protein
MGNTAIYFELHVLMLAIITRPSVPRNRCPEQMIAVSGKNQRDHS